MLNGKFDELNDRVSSDSPCREYFREISMNEQVLPLRIEIELFCLFVYLRIWSIRFQTRKRWNGTKRRKGTKSGESTLLCVGLVTESHESYYDYYDYNGLLFKVLFHITFLDGGVEDLCIFVYLFIYLHVTKILSFNIIN